MFNENFCIAGLGEETVSIPAAGIYSLDGKIQLPRLAAGASGPSGAVMTIVNSTGPTTIYTGTAGKDGFKLDTVCALGDVLTFTLTSANDVDEEPGVLKTTVAVSSGV